MTERQMIIDTAVCTNATVTLCNTKIRVLDGIVEITWDWDDTRQKPGKGIPFKPKPRKWPKTKK